MILPFKTKGVETIKDNGLLNKGDLNPFLSGTSTPFLSARPKNPISIDKPLLKSSESIIAPKTFDFKNYFQIKQFKI